MVRKLFKTGNSLVVSLPKETDELLGLREGSEMTIVVDADERRIILAPVKPDVANIDAEFARQLDDFIERYRPALEALAR